MTHVSRPLIALLVATVLVFALYMVALKPATSSGGGGSHAGTYQSAIAKAHAVQGLVNGAGSRDGGSPSASATPTTKATTSTPTTTLSATTPAGTSQHGQTPSKAKTTNGKSTPSASASGSAATKTGTGAAKSNTTTRQTETPAARRFHTVQVALDHHKVLALLFYNPASPDDRTVETELASIPTHGGAVVKLAVPLQELASYASLLSSVPVNFSPTLVLIDRQRQAQEITGFATSFEIDRRVADSLGS